MNLRVVVFAAALVLSGCAPKVYVIDRQTVLEEEAAGHWPDFEKELLKKAKAAGPTLFSETPMSARRARLYNVLNGSTVVSDEPAKEVKKK